MTHVFMMNMCFDVPVKLYSLIYLMMAVFLAAPELPRFFRVLVLGQAAPARSFPRLLLSVALDRIAVVVRTLLVLAMLYGQVRGSYKLWSDMYGGPPAPLAGRWDLVSMQVDQNEPGKDDPTSCALARFQRPEVHEAGRAETTEQGLHDHMGHREQEVVTRSVQSDCPVGNLHLRAARARLARTGGFHGRQSHQRDAHTLRRKSSMSS